MSLEGNKDAWSRATSLNSGVARMEVVVILPRVPRSRFSGETTRVDAEFMLSKFEVWFVFGIET